MSEEYSAVIRCRMCLGGTKVVLSLPSKPLRTGDVMKFPLDIRECGSCGHHQIGYIVPAETIYAERKADVSESQRMLLEKYASDLASEFSGKALEIGVNNGAFCAELNKAGFEAYSIDPTVTNSGMPKWFTSKSAVKLAETMFKFDLIVSSDMMDCMDDIRNVFRSVEICLADNGSFVFDVNYFPAIANDGLEERVSHERKDYFSLSPFTVPLRKFGLCVYKAEKFGNKMRLYIKRGINGIPLKDSPCSLMKVVA